MSILLVIYTKLTKLKILILKYFTILNLQDASALSLCLSKWYLWFIEINMWLFLLVLDIRFMLSVYESTFV